MYQLKPMIHEIGLMILIQFITEKHFKKKGLDLCLNKQIIDPENPKIKAKVRFFCNKGFANPKTNW